MNLYRTIAADPPRMPELGATWKSSFNDKSRPHRQYETLTVEQIKRLPIPSAAQAHLYLWAIAQHVDWAYDVARAWGFDPVILLTWKKPGLGTGRFQCNTEYILVGRKGSRHGNPFGQGGRTAPATGGTHFDWPGDGEIIGSDFEWPRGKHSEKPAEFYSLVEKLSPSPRLDLFARRKREGWSVWGNEVESDVQIVVPAAV